MRLQIVDINDRGLFSLCELRLYFSLNVQRKCSEWIKLATINFQNSLGQNPARSREVAPLLIDSGTTGVVDDGARKWPGIVKSLLKQAICSREWL